MLKWKKLIIHFNFKQGCKALEAGYQKHLDDGIIFNLIFAQTAQYMAPFAVYLGKKHKIPVVATEHYPPLRQMTTVWDMDEITNGLIINSLNQVDRLFTVSQYVSSVLYLLGVKNRMYNVGNMVDERLFIIKDGIRSEPFYVTFIGYNYFVKDPLTMFKAIAEIKKQGVKNIRFRLINSVNDFIELVNRFQVQDYVELLIQVPRPEMIKIITENTDLLVSTSICETFGLSMVEALLSGIPVVATNSGGPQDFLNAGNSIIIENMDYMGLTNAILKIKNKEITFDRNALRNSVINKFGTEAFTHRLVKQINEIAYL
jgi:glycosyltransferase involved in cell wall biosynthesis